MFVVLRVRLIFVFALLLSSSLSMAAGPDLLPPKWCPDAVAFAKRIYPTWTSRFRGVSGDDVLRAAERAVRPNSFFQFKVVRHRYLFPIHYEARLGIFFGLEHGNLSYFLASPDEGSPGILSTGGVESFEAGPRGAYDQLSLQFQRDVVPHVIPVQIERVRADVIKNEWLLWPEFVRTLDVFAASAYRGHTLKLEFKYNEAYPWQSVKHIYFESGLKRDGTYAPQVRLRMKSRDEATEFLKLFDRWMGAETNAPITLVEPRGVDDYVARYATSTGLWADLYRIPDATEEDDYSDLVPGAPSEEGGFLLDIFPMGDENWNRILSTEEFRTRFAAVVTGEKGGISVVPTSARARALKDLVEAIFTRAKLAKHEMPGGSFSPIASPISFSGDAAGTPAAGPASTQTPMPSLSDGVR